MEKEIKDKELVRLAKAGDKDSFRILVERYQKRAFTIAYGIVKSHEEAEDVIQESFVKAYISLKKFKGESSFYTWLYRIVYNMSIDVTRRKARRGGEAFEYDEGRDGGEQTGRPLRGSVEGPAEALQRRETGKRIQQAMDQLSEEHRTVVVLREFEGMSYDDIAESMDISRGTVMSRIHYARKHLQKILMSDDFADKDEAKVVNVSDENLVPSMSK